jgi:hypothetical protein
MSTSSRVKYRFASIEFGIFGRFLGSPCALKLTLAHKTVAEPR